MALLTDIGNSLSNLWKQGSTAVGNEVKQYPQQVSNAFGPAAQTLNPFGNRNVFSQAAQGNLNTGIAPLNFAGQQAGQFIQNKLINPIGNLPTQLHAIVNPQSTLQQRGMGALGAAGDVLNYTPAAQAMQAGQGALYGGINALRTGQNIPQAVMQGATGQKQVGLGSALTDNKQLAGVGNFAGNFLTPGNISKGLHALTSAQGAQMLKGISPNVFNMHPEDEKLALSLADTVLNTKDSLSPTDAKYLQTLAEHYLGGKYVAGTNKQIAQAFQYALASKYNGIPGQLPKMGLTNEQPTAQAAIPPVSTTPVGNPLAEGAKERQFTTSVKESPEVSPQVQGQVQGSYNPKSNDILKNQSATLVGQGLDKATNQVIGDLGQKKGTLSDQNVSDAIAVAKAHDEAGNFDQATQIYDKLAEHLTEAGRQVQAASLLSSRTPQGMLYTAQKVLKKSGVPLEGEVKSNVENLINQVKQAVPGSNEEHIASQKFINYVNSNIPRSKTDAVTGIWRAGLLTGPETVSKVMVSHGVTTPFELAAQIPADLHDRIAALLTGKRSLTATMQGFGGGVARGTKAMGVKLKTGIDMPGTGGFENKLGGSTKQTAYENTINNIHGSLPKPMFAGRYDVSLHDQALTQATNKGLQGAEKNAFVKDFVSKPTDQAKQIAQNDAEVATNQNETSAGKLANTIQNWSPGGAPVGKILAPFTRIPSAIGVNALWKYTPFGYGSEVAKQIQSGTLDQRALSQAFGRSATGTSLAALGSLLAYHGLMTLKAPTDPKEQALWNAEGKQPNSIKVGNTWISLNALGPIGIVLGIGGGFGQSLQQDPTNIAGAAERSITSGGKVLLDQPYLKGISGVGNALNDPARYAQSFFNTTAGSVVPAGIQQAARGADTVQRMYPKDLAGKFQSEIPGLREGLPKQRDLYGNTLPGSNPSGSIPGAIAGTVNPFYPSSATPSDPVTNELQRLYSAQGSSGTPDITPPSSSQSIYGQKVKLSNQQLSDFVAQEGPQVKQALSSVIASPDYQQLSDAQKKTVLDGAISQYKNNNFLKSTVIGQNGQPGQSLAGSLSVVASGGKGGMTSYQLQAAKDAFANSSSNFKDLGNVVLRKDSSGNVAVITKDAYNTSLYEAQMAYAKNGLDGNTYQATGAKLLDLYQKQLNDPNVDQLDKLQIMNKMNTLTKALDKTGKAKHAAKISIKSAGIPKITAFKSTPIKIGKTTKLGTSHANTLRIGKQPKAAVGRSIAKASTTKTAAKFKISNPRVYLSSAGSSQRGIRKAAGISVPTHKRKTPILTI